MKEILRLLIKNNEKSAVAQTQHFTPEGIISINPMTNTTLFFKKNLPLDTNIVVSNKLLKQSLHLIDNPYFEFDKDKNTVIIKDANNNKQLRFQFFPDNDSEEYIEHFKKSIGNPIIELSDFSYYLPIFKTALNFVDTDTTSTLHCIYITAENGKMRIESTNNLALYRAEINIDPSIKIQVGIRPNIVELADIIFKYYSSATFTIHEDGIKISANDIELYSGKIVVNFPNTDMVLEGKTYIETVKTNAGVIRQIKDLLTKTGENFITWKKDKIIVENEFITYEEKGKLPSITSTIKPYKTAFTLADYLQPDTEITISYDEVTTLFQHKFKDANITVLTVNVRRD